MASQHEYVAWRQRWPSVVVERQTDAAVDLLAGFYATSDSGMPRYTGARFEAVAALNGDSNVLGPADFVAVSMLSVTVDPKAAIRLLEQDSADITALLRQIPADRDIVDVHPDELISDSSASQLWRLLRSGNDGLGRTKTSKLMAAKRPRLIPIWDSFVEDATGLNTVDYWRQFQSVLLADDRAIWNWLGELRDRVPDMPPGVSNLRILDVLLWMSVHRKRHS